MKYDFKMVVLIVEWS